MNKEIPAPFLPEQADNFDEKVTNDGWKDEDTDKMKESAILLRRDSVQDLFKGYYYDQSFEGFGFKIEDKPKPIKQARKPIHHSVQQSPRRNAPIGNHHRSQSGKQNPLVNIHNIRRQESEKPANKSI